MSCGFRFLLVVLLLSTSASAQVPTTLTPDDTSAIQALVTGYARALAACRAEEFADLFAPDTGYFASGIRGQVVGRERLKRGTAKWSLPLLDQLIVDASLDSEMVGNKNCRPKAGHRLDW